MKVTINYHDKDQSKRDDVAHEIAKRGLKLEVSNDYWHTVKVSSPEAANELMAGLMDIPNIQLQIEA